MQSSCGFLPRSSFPPSIKERAYALVSFKALNAAPSVQTSRSAARPDSRRADVMGGDLLPAC